MEGQDVVTSDDQKLGTVIAEQDDCVIIETGHVFKANVWRSGVNIIGLNPAPWIVGNVAKSGNPPPCRYFTQRRILQRIRKQGVLAGFGSVFAIAGTCGKISACAFIRPSRTAVQ